MAFPPLANAQIVIHPFEPGDADDFVRAAHESIEVRQALTCTVIP